jgi:hypothetical protein
METTMTVTHQAANPEPPGDPHYRPRPGFVSPEVARRAALIFTAMGCTGAEIRAGKHPDDRLFAELADGVDAVLAEGLTPADCLALLGIGADPADGAR